jgi:2,4-dienoyl-CoA reductase-like NADH-dependent reductase (Old Yellow Enzyme family)
MILADGMNLFESIEINGMQLKNRICQAPLLSTSDVADKMAILDGFAPRLKRKCDAG